MEGCLWRTDGAERGAAAAATLRGDLCIRAPMDAQCGASVFSIRIARNQHDAADQPAGIRPGQPGSGRWGQLGRTGLPGGGRHAALHPAGRGCVPVGCGRQALHRLCGFLGAGHRRARPPGGDCRRAGRCSQRAVVWRALRERERARREDLRHVPARGTRALYEFRHGIHHVGTAAGPRLYGAQPHHQVRGLLPRYGRQPAGEGRQRRPGLRQPQLGRRAGRCGQAYADRPLQRSGERACALRAVPG